MRLHPTIEQYSLHQHSQPGEDVSIATGRMAARFAAVCLRAGGR
ncbi:MAG: hypothetical protein ACK6EB_17930 [Planctomyces sp.]|jgi:hypothetical protein